jgi:alkanesulfonate monooxygenase SsuD/methylene tetrahydromethanopterin reductase-like flavin-dependent oxidoreductase (luciferase family)
MDVKVGVYFDLRNPVEWRQDSVRLHAFTLEMCEEAERLGADGIWVSEHHLFADGYLTQPLTFLAAVAARTKRIRLGTGILIAPFRHPAHIAEEAALVDILSNGRLELGLGTGFRLPEFQLFDSDIEKRGATLAHHTREIRRLWDSGSLTPPPVQARIPIWVGYLTAKGARRAGLLGENLMAVGPDLVQPYREGLIEGGHNPASAKMGGSIQAFVTDDPERDWPIVAKHVDHQVNSYHRYAVEGGRQAANVADPEQLRRKAIGYPPLSYFLCETPEALAAKILAYTQGAPVETVWLWASVSGMPEAMVARHVNTICTKLRPLLQ